MLLLIYLKLYYIPYFLSCLEVSSHPLYFQNVFHVYRKSTNLCTHVDYIFMLFSVKLLICCKSFCCTDNLWFEVC